MKLVSRLLVLVAFLACVVPAQAEKKAVVRANGLNLRSLPSLDAPVLGKLQAGEQVEVIAEVDGPDKGGPARRWARISTSGKTGRPVWAAARYIDTNGAVTATVLKLRSGPGQQFSEMGQLKKGDRVAVAESRDGWNRLEDRDWVGYVAAEFLQITEEKPALAAVPPSTPPAGRTPPPTERPPTTVPVPVEPPPAPPITPAAEEILDRTGGERVAAVPPATAPEAAAATGVPPISGNVVTLPAQPELVYEAKKPRIVIRDGVVRRALNPKKPTFYELRSHRGEGVLNLLVAEDPAIDLEWWVGRRATVTGEEGIEEEWRTTPLIKVQSIRETF